MTTRVAVLAYPGVDALDLFGVHSVLLKAVDAGADLRVSLAAAERRATTSCGVELAVRADLGEVESADVVVVAGGRGAADAAEDPALIVALRTAARRGAALYAVCSGVLLIAAAGLARSRRVAVHEGKRGLLRAYRVGEVVTGLVRDGALCTVGGDAAPSVKSVDLAFALLAERCPDVVRGVAARMEVVPGRVAR